MSSSKSLPFWSGIWIQAAGIIPADPARRPSPTSLDPFVQVGSLVPHPGRSSVAGQDQRVGVEGGEDAAIDGLDDRAEVGVLEGRVARAAGEERVAREQEVRALDGEADGAPGAAGPGQGLDAQVAHAE